jgi:hypothetical protein
MAGMGEVHLLPPQNHRARVLALALMVLTPFAFGALAVALGQDANWDLRNYHWYNAYSLLHWRYGFDLLPSQTPWFYNAVLDVPFYLLATHVPAITAGYILGFVQGFNFALLFMLAYASLSVPLNPWAKTGVCSFLSLLGLLGGGGIALVGTTFYDNVTSLGLFASLLFVIRYSESLMTLPPRCAFQLALLCGLPAGLAMGLKLPSVVFCIGLCFAFLLAGPMRRRFLLAFAFGIGITLGIMVTLGPWAVYLQTHFGSPLFPYFNEVFRSPMAPVSDGRDAEFIPHGGHDVFLFPFLFAKSPTLVGEITWQDWRLPILYALALAVIALRMIVGSRDQSAIAKPYATRYLLGAAAMSYFVWMFLFAIYRYAIPLEMLAPLLITLAAGLLPFGVRTRAAIVAVLLIVTAFSIQPGNWGRRDAWLDRFVEATIPPLPKHDNMMILMAGFEPYAHIVPEFPPDIAFVRIQSNFASPGEDKGINAVIRARVAEHMEHKGDFMLLMPPWQLAMGDDALAYFGLARSPGPCLPVIDRLYNDNELSLCKVIRRNQKF